MTLPRKTAKPTRRFAVPLFREGLRSQMNAPSNALYRRGLNGLVPRDYAVNDFHWLLDGELYVPQSWPAARRS